MPAKLKLTYKLVDQIAELKREPVRRRHHRRHRREPVYVLPLAEGR